MSLTVHHLRAGDLVETNDGFHLIVGLEKDEKYTKVFVYSLAPNARRTGKDHFLWSNFLPLFDPKWDGSKFILRFYRNGERLK